MVAVISDVRLFSMMMAKISLVILALFVAAATSAVIESRDSLLRRVARSPHCGACDSQLGPPPSPPGFGHAPPPFPPPPFFRTHQWSGLARTADGSQQGVFSGAAAAAEGGPQATGEAFSLASSAVGSGGSGSAKGSQPTSNNAQSSNGYKSQSARGSSSNSNEGYESQSRGYDGASGNYGRYAGGGEQKYGSSGSYKEPHYSYQNGGRFEEQGSLQSSNNGFGDNEQQQVKSGFGSSSRSEAENSAFGRGGSAQGSVSSSTGREHQNEVQQQERIGRLSSGSQFRTQGGDYGGSNGYGESRGHASHAVDTGFSRHEQQQLQLGSQNPRGGRGYGSSSQLQSGSSLGNNLQQLQTDSNNGQLQEGSSSNAASTSLTNGNSDSAATSQAAEDTQSTISGALNLASQGLQTAQQTGCSTCGKSSYALSNAKSHSGSAVALSISG